MKKLLFVLLGVAAATCTHAAVVVWSTQWEVCDGTQSETSFTTASMAYLIDASVYDSAKYSSSQAEIYALVNGGQSLASVVDGKALGSSSMSGGLIPGFSKEFPQWEKEGTVVNAYMVLFDENVGEMGSLYFSEELGKTVQAGNTGTAWDFYSESSLNLPAADMSGFSAATGGWVNAPEPTSGMLLLLGMAGLALKRKRA